MNSCEVIKSYHTGDIGVIKNDKLYVLGRKDNQIKFKGYRIELEYIENNIKKVIICDDDVVVPVKDSNVVIKFLKAYVTLNNGDITILREELKKFLLEYMVPRDLMVIDRSGLLDSYASISLFSTLEDYGVLIYPTRIDRDILKITLGIQKLVDDYLKKKNKYVLNSTLFGCNYTICNV